MVKEGLFEPLEYSELAAPIVPVRKSAGSMRICRDYKITVNKITQFDKYLVPKTEGLLATLNWGERFSKVDLSRAYQQLVLDEGSRKYLTVNTGKGLFQPIYLQYGIHSAADIFQREMEKRVSHVPFTVVRMDDILISGKNGYLDSVLDIVEKCNLRLKKEKCVL